jgi:membrane protease subunit HflK
MAEEHNHNAMTPDVPAPAPAGPGETDPAMRSLSDSLRVSFALLRILMVLFVILFLLTGVKTIKSNEAGIVKVFGRNTAVVGEGLVYNWPFPIGEIEVVDVSQKNLTVDNFWMHETPDEAGKPLATRSRRNEGLEPGKDGALLTGDRYFVHIKIQCTYSIRNALAVVSRVTQRTQAATGDPTQSQSATSDALETVINEFVCDAAIRAAATRTAEDIRGEPEAFLEQIRGDVQDEVDTLVGKDAVRIDNILLPQSDAVTWPLAAYDAYERAQAAQSEKQRKIDEAVSEATKLAEVIGKEHFQELVGQPWNLNRLQEQRWTAAGVDEKDRPYNLIGQLTGVQGRIEALRRQAGPPNPEQLAALEEQARQLRARIDNVLTRADTGGEVSQVIRTADAERTAVIQSAERRAEQFQRLLAQYRQAPDVFLQKLWSEVYDDIVQQPTNMKYYLSPGQKGQTVIRINPDPDVLQELLDYQWEQKRTEQQQKRRGG